MRLIFRYGSINAPTSTQQVDSLLADIGENIYSVREIMELMGLKDE